MEIESQIFDTMPLFGVTVFFKEGWICQTQVFQTTISMWKITHALETYIVIIKRSS